jgi:hypothetical protein
VPGCLVKISATNAIDQAHDVITETCMLVMLNMSLDSVDRVTDVAQRRQKRSVLVSCGIDTTLKSIQELAQLTDAKLGVLTLDIDVPTLSELGLCCIPVVVKHGVHFVSDLPVLRLPGNVCAQNCGNLRELSGTWRVTLRVSQRPVVERRLFVRSLPQLF